MANAVFIGGPWDGQHVTVCAPEPGASSTDSDSPHGEPYVRHFLNNTMYQMLVHTDLSLEDALGRLLEHYRPR